MEKLCFPGNARVTITMTISSPQNNNNTDGDREIQIQMHSLRVGMSVKSASNSYSPVFMLSHSESAGKYPFISLNNLTVSAGHYVYTVEKGLIPARKVRIGYHLLTDSKSNNNIEKVSTISHAREKGLFNPHTLDGTLVVNGYLTSTYTEAIPQSVCNSLLAPFRMLFSAFGKDLTFGKLEQNSKVRSTIVNAML